MWLFTKSTSVITMGIFGNRLHDLQVKTIFRLRLTLLHVGGSKLQGTAWKHFVTVVFCLL